MIITMDGWYGNNSDIQLELSDEEDGIYVSIIDRKRCIASLTVDRNEVVRALIAIGEKEV